MDFIRIIRSVEELIFEMMSWLVLYPVTLWRSIFQPVELSKELDNVLTENIDHEFRHHIRPTLFLLLTLALMHSLELALNETFPEIKSKLGQLVSMSDGALILLRAFMFATVAIIMGFGRQLRDQSGMISRNFLRLVFFKQCYYVAPFAIFSSLAVIIGRIDATYAQPLSAIIGGVGFLWFFPAQVKWCLLNGETSLARSIFLVALKCIAALLAVLAISSIVVAV